MKRKADKYLYPNGDKDIVTNIECIINGVLSHHQINPNSKLARVVRNTVQKLLIGAEQRLLNYDNWYMKNKKALRMDNPSCANACSPKLLVKEYYKTKKVPSNFMRYLNTELGRLNVQLNSYMLLNKYSNDIGHVNPKSDHKSNPTLAVLGTIIRKVIDLHANTYGVRECFTRNILAERDDLKELKQSLRIK